MNRLKCSKCQNAAKYIYLPKEDYPVYCDDCINRGCSCTFIYETKEYEKDSKGRLLPCVEYGFSSLGYLDDKCRSNITYILGTKEININNFIITISYDESDIYDLFYLIKITENFGLYNVYINPHKDPRFFIDFSVNPDELKKETTNKEIYRVEHRWYEAFKKLQQPLFKFHLSSIERLIEQIEIL